MLAYCLFLNSFAYLKEMHLFKQTITHCEDEGKVLELCLTPDDYLGRNMQFLWGAIWEWFPSIFFLIILIYSVTLKFPRIFS